MKLKDFQQSLNQMENKCPECGIDPTPITIGGQVIQPCGKIPASVQGYMLPSNIKWNCPGTKIQTGIEPE